MPSIHILILEDNPSDAELTLHQLRQEFDSFEYDLANNRESFLTCLRNHPDVILADYALPQFTALDALTLVQARGLDIPLIIVSGTIGEEVAVEAMRLGATDYLLKDRLGRLSSAILRALDEAKTRQARRMAEEALRESEARYRSLFEDSPVSLWEEDFSAIKTEIDRVKASGVADPYAYYRNDLDALRSLIRHRKVLAVNQTTLRMYHGENHPMAITQLAEIFSDDSLLQFLEELFAFYKGEKQFSCETIHKTLEGDEIFVSQSASLAPGYENTWGKVLTTIVDISARKQAEEAIVQSERLLRSVLDASPDWIFAKDRDHRYVIANETFADALGYSVLDVIGKTDVELGLSAERMPGNPNDVPNGFTSTDQQVFDIGEALSGYDVKVTQNGEKSWVFDSVKVPLKDHAGMVWAVLGIARDISERLRNERALRESEEVLSKIMDANPNAIYIMDREGRYRIINQAEADIYHLPKEEIIGLTCKEVAEKGRLLPKEAAGFWNNAMRVVRTGKPVFIPEESATNREGGIRWFQTRLTPLPHNQNELMVLGVSTDITERKQSADVLRRLNETLELRVDERTAALAAATRDLEFLKDQMETILQNSPDGFLLLDETGMIQQVNQGYLRMMNVKQSEVLGQSFSRHLIEVGVVTADQYLAQARQDQKQVAFEVRLSPSGTGNYDYVISIIPVYDKEDLSAFVVNMHDVSEAKEVQRMKDAFVSNVSHELRTPITNFICNLELIRIRPDNMNVYLDRLERETDHLKNLIEDLLHLSRLDQGSIGIGKTPIDLNHLCANFTEMRQPLADAKGLTLQFHPDKEPMIAFVDEGLISQVLSILLTNAINYTPKGGMIDVRVVRSREALGFSVCDTGPGITAEDQKRITQRFYRGSVGLESGVSGTGLGLSIAEEILTLHDGHLEISSDGIPGHGATFTVWLPIFTE